MEVQLQDQLVHAIHLSHSVDTSLVQSYLHSRIAEGDALAAAGGERWDATDEASGGKVGDGD